MLGRPAFCRHLRAIICGNRGGQYERQAVHRRVKIEAVKQVTERAHSVVGVAQRLAYWHSKATSYFEPDARNALK